MIKNGVLILTKKVKLKKSLTLFSVLVLCVCLQFSSLIYPFQKIKESNATLTEVTKVSATVESSSMKVSRGESTYQNFNIDGKIITISSKENFKLGQEVPVWIHESNNEMVRGGEGSTDSDDITYSLTKISTQENIKIGFWLNVLLFILTILNFFAMGVIINFFMFLYYTDEVKEPERAFGSQKNNSYWSLDYLPNVTGSTRGMVTQMILTLPFAAPSMHMFLSQFNYIASLKTMSIGLWVGNFFLSFTIAFFVSALFHSINKIDNFTAHYFVKFAWGFNLYNMPAQGTPWHDKSVRDKLNKWFSKDNVDLEVVDILKESFTGTLKELKETAKAFGPDA